MATETKVFAWGYGTTHYVCCRTKTEAARLAGCERARQLENLHESHAEHAAGRLAAERPGKVITTKPNSGRAIDGETVYEGSTVIGQIVYGPEVHEPYRHTPLVFVPAEPTPDPVTPAGDMSGLRIKARVEWLAALDEGVVLAGCLSRGDYLEELVRADRVRRGLGPLPARVPPSKFHPHTLPQS